MASQDTARLSEKLHQSAMTPLGEFEQNFSTRPPKVGHFSLVLK
jgi:hypothetical protein